MVSIWCLKTLGSPSAHTGNSWIFAQPHSPYSPLLWFVVKSIRFKSEKTRCNICNVNLWEITSCCLHLIFQPKSKCCWKGIDSRPIFFAGFVLKTPKNLVSLNCFNNFVLSMCYVFFSRLPSSKIRIFIIFLHYQYLMNDSAKWWLDLLGESLDESQFSAGWCFATCIFAKVWGIIHHHNWFTTIFFERGR